MNNLSLFTAMSEQLDTETLAALLGQYLERGQAIVARHGGTVDKYIGDSIMAFWGAPMENEKHASNAVRAGLGRPRLVGGLGGRLFLCHALGHARRSLPLVPGGLGG